jgi:Neprosin
MQPEAAEEPLLVQWYIGGSGSSEQTVEGGWVHYPAKFGNNSVLFTYFTNDGYAPANPGCYNLECRAFVQVNGGWALGSGFTQYSSYGGPQLGFQMQWKHFRGNWWLLLAGSGHITAIGYYPGSLYHNGALASNASIFSAGGEVCNGLSLGGDTCTNPDWPQMGSGKFAAAGFGQAAFQKQVFYIPIDDDNLGTWVNPAAITESAKCYTITFTPAIHGGTWGSYFFFGGPGGFGC